MIPSHSRVSFSAQAPPPPPLPPPPPKPVASSRPRVSTLKAAGPLIRGWGEPSSCPSCWEAAGQSLRLENPGKVTTPCGQLAPCRASHGGHTPVSDNAKANKWASPGTPLSGGMSSGADVFFQPNTWAQTCANMFQTQLRAHREGLWPCTDLQLVGKQGESLAGGRHSPTGKASWRQQLSQQGESMNGPQSPLLPTVLPLGSGFSHFPVQPP